MGNRLPMTVSIFCSRILLAYHAPYLRRWTASHGKYRTSEGVFVKDFTLYSV
ncbi:hypothetical protein T4C_7753 [Trichinella pseudospiralis]|uniref:Uncharacterized protein n=1 Tax=Trichinella pseudospiralis TaxID=6337 RepID=A0A0V1IM62_TRIPS|nr:hypothetical protein T4C_7753 [Trichinella pseudospiralis]